MNMNLKEVSTVNLIAELKDRGFKTQFLMSVTDLNNVLDEINNSRGGVGMKVEFSKAQKDEIIDSINYEMFENWMRRELNDALVEKYIIKNNPDLFPQQ